MYFFSSCFEPEIIWILESTCLFPIQPPSNHPPSSLLSHHPPPPPSPPPLPSVYAEYTIKFPNNLAVHNYANERGVNDIIHDAQLCATIKDPQNDPGRLAVGPCLFFFELLDQFIYGPYFIVAYDEAEGYALVSGGSPTIPTKDGLCTTQRGFNNAGLWVFSRSNVRNEALIQKVRGIAVSKGFDVDVLEDVQHVGCNYTPSSAPRSLRT